ncbi:hypothetical protein CCACVL1_06674 [Corchorus capsularis]|uniref:Uncharacterized protein n=1 Tax=Corchorus capsularis TaxID=210143 RepID=A0A1R3JDY2_COCAP|nr:hypothetical protein CCACVL1_06674 [Corchorus capsularis]
MAVMGFIIRDRDIWLLTKQNNKPTNLYIKQLEQ